MSQFGFELSGNEDFKKFKMAGVTFLGFQKAEGRCKKNRSLDQLGRNVGNHRRLRFRNRLREDERETFRLES